MEAAGTSQEGGWGGPLHSGDGQVFRDEYGSALYTLLLLI